MEPFDTLTGIAAPLPMANVDTDKIIPARFMKTIKRQGLGANLFDGLRYADGAERTDFVLNRAPFSKAQILVTHENFGCGSSREHAPWALLDFGIRAIIAPSFADIFYANCFKNGILPIVLDKDTCNLLMEDAELGPNGMITVNLGDQSIIRPGGERIAFDVDPFRKSLLMSGDDDIGLTLRQAERIAAFETERRASEWLFPQINTVL